MKNYTQKQMERQYYNMDGGDVSGDDICGGNDQDNIDRLGKEIEEHQQIMNTSVEKLKIMEARLRDYSESENPDRDVVRTYVIGI